jgi:hypothetical protein
MIRQTCSLGLSRPCLPAVLVLGLLPVTAIAETFAFRNECNAPVVIQTVSVFRGRVFRDRPYLLNPADATPGVILPGDKLITVYDARIPNRILFRGTVPAGPADIIFGVVPDVVPGRVRIEMRRVLPPR